MQQFRQAVSLKKSIHLKPAKRRLGFKQAGDTQLKPAFRLPALGLDARVGCERLAEVIGAKLEVA
jgi:hypothetical protein